jgi:hypothetical protein
MAHKGARSRLDSTISFEHLLEAYEHAGRRLSFAAVDAVNNCMHMGDSQERAWAKCQVAWCKAARVCNCVSAIYMDIVQAHTRLYVVRTFLSALRNINDASVAAVMDSVARLYAVHTLLQHTHNVTEVRGGHVLYETPRLRPLAGWLHEWTTGAHVARMSCASTACTAQ